MSQEPPKKDYSTAILEGK